MKPDTQKFKAEFRRWLAWALEMQDQKTANSFETRLFGMHAAIEALGLYELAAWCEKELNAAGLQ